MYRGRRKYSRKFKRTKGGTSWRVDTSRIKKVERKLNTIMPEKKLYDQTMTTVSLVNTGVVTLIGPNLAQGDQSINREGLKINLKSLDVKMFAASGGAGDLQLCRVIFFMDKSCNGDNNLPTIAGDDESYLESTSVIAHKKHENIGRWITLYDKIFRLSDTQGVETKVMSFYKSWKTKKMIHYTGTTAAQASMGPNCIYCITLSNAATTVPLLTAEIRARFYD